MNDKGDAVADHDSGLLDRPGTAKHLGISLRTLDRLQQRHEIRYVEIGGRIKFHPADIAAYIDAHTVDADDDERRVG